jgi:hypothetical protein
MPMNEIADHCYHGARALVLLHERSMRELLSTWLQAKAAGLRLPDPDIDPAPEAPCVERDAARWKEHLLACWRPPLAEIEEARFNEVHLTRWGIEMCIESMLEHAVLHPARHRFQLEELREAP